MSSISRDSGSTGGTSYKSYTVVLSQAGVAAPTVSYTLDNTIGTIVWSRNFGGLYTGTLSNAFVNNKTFCLTTLYSQNARTGSSLNRVDNNTVELRIYDDTNTEIDDWNLNVEIRVYS